MSRVPLKRRKEGEYKNHAPKAKQDQYPKPISQPIVPTKNPQNASWMHPSHVNPFRHEGLSIRGGRNRGLIRMVDEIRNRHCRVGLARLIRFLSTARVLIKSS
jgi:hypothetical protein